jgi:5-methylthioadenosine/S-adenosylhomocysteine deaminase
MPLEPADLLIEARWLLPIAPVNTVLEDHAVAVTAGRIVSIGPIAHMRSRFQPREHVSRGEHHALLPGFVNAHTHAAMTLLRGLPVQGPRARWLGETVRPAEHRCVSPDFVRDGAQLAIAEMLRAGITSFADMYLFPDEVARAASAARMRAAIGLPVADAPNAWAEDATEHLAKAERLWDEYKSDPWVSLYFAPHDADSITDRTLARVQRVADELDARVAIAAHTSITDINESLARHGRRPLQRFQELGLLRPGFTGIHMSSLAHEDLELIVKTGVCVVACVQSDLRFGGDACPLRDLDVQHVVVGLGTGDPVSAGALDMLAEARVAALLTNEIRAEDVLRMATLGGANALGLGSLTGSIEPGKAADLVCWDLGGPGTVLADIPASRVADSLVFGATRQQVTDVWTSGRPAVSNGNLLAFDDQEMRALARQWTQRVAQRETNHDP